MNNDNNNNNKQSENYENKISLGNGNFGEIFIVLNKIDYKYYIMKKIKIKSHSQVEKLNKSLTSLDKKNNQIVNYINSFTEPKSNNHYNHYNYCNIIMEFCDGLKLNDFLNQQKMWKRPLKPEIIYYIFYNICLGINEIHKNNLIHGHLNPDNIFLTEDLMVKIGDFGLTSQLIHINSEGKKIDKKVDIWLLGCILYELCTLNKYSKNSDKKINEEYGKILQNLINILLKEDPDSRLSISQVLFIVKNYINKDIQLKQNIFYNFLQNEAYEYHFIENSIKRSFENIININNNENENDKDINTCYSLLDYLPFPFPSGMNNIKDNKKFINDNIYIFDTIIMKSAEIIMNKFDEKIKNKEIIVYNEDTFYRNILKIGRIFTSQKYLNYLKDNEIQEMQNNILVINVENLNINKLINRFLNLSENENDSLDPKEYNGLRNNKKYNIFKINGVSKSFSNMIDKIFNLDHPNCSIDCIWYCFQGKNINDIDKQYIKALLLSVYDTQKISIIFINFKKSNNYSNDECKKSIQKIFK